MSCYHPNIRIVDTSKWIKAKDGHSYHPAKIQSVSKIYGEMLEDYYKKHGYEKYQYEIIPCKQCIGCRLDYSREWANRGYLESLCYIQNWFITLTYDENHITIPEYIEDKNGFTYTEQNEGDWKGILIPKDLQQFMKNLRQIIKREKNEENIRFMASGEYGSEGERPHYHIILFNCNLPLDSFYDPHIINKEVYYKNKILDRAWSNKGIVEISEADWNTIAYTARYITKKLNGNGTDELYAEYGQIKEFLRVSNKPGIGKPYYDKHKHEIYKNDEIIIHNKEGAISCKPPKYFDYLYEKEYPKEFEKIKKNRIKQQKNSNFIKNQQTSLSILDQLEVEERTKTEKTQKLIRSFENQKN